MQLYVPVRIPLLGFSEGSLPSSAFILPLLFSPCGILRASSNMGNPSTLNSFVVRRRNDLDASPIVDSVKADARVGGDI